MEQEENKCAMALEGIEVRMTRLPPQRGPGGKGSDLTLDNQHGILHKCLGMAIFIHA